MTQIYPYNAEIFLDDRGTKPHRVHSSHDTGIVFSHKLRYIVAFGFLHQSEAYDIT